MDNLKITLKKSLSGRLQKHIATANSLGLKRPGDVTVQPNNCLLYTSRASTSASWK